MVWLLNNVISTRSYLFKPVIRHLVYSKPVIRQLSYSKPVFAIPKKTKLPPRPKWLIIEEELDEKFLKGGRGPGGQKINKTNSKVQLTHLPTGIVVTCQLTRSQEQNRKKAREILALRLDDLQNPETSRNAVIQDRKSKLKLSKAKKSNRKYRKLEEEKEEENDTEELDPEDEFDQFVASINKSTPKDSST